MFNNSADNGAQLKVRWISKINSTVSNGIQKLKYHAITCKVTVWHVHKIFTQNLNLIFKYKTSSQQEINLNLLWYYNRCFKTCMVHLFSITNMAIVIK